MSKIYLKVTIETFSNFLLSWFKKFVTRSVFGEFQLTQILLKFKSSCNNLKIRGTWEQNCVWLFYYFNFERSYGILTSKIPWTLLNKNINLNKNKTEMKMENPHTVLKRRPLCFSSYKNWKLKVTLWLKKKEGIFCTVYFVRKEFFQELCFISMYSVLNTFSEYTYFNISKNITSYTFAACF